MFHELVFRNAECGSFFCTMKRLNILICFLTFSSTVNAGSHSLLAFATYIAGKTPFPEVSAVVMLDDVQLGYYDSADRKYVHRRPHTNSEDYDSEQKDAGVVFGSMFEDIKYTTTRLRKQFNSTNEIDVFQRIMGCELLDGDVPGQVKLLDSYSGFAGDLQEMNFNLQKKTLVWSMDSIIDWRIYTESGAKAVVENIYQPICIKILRRYLQREKRYLLRKVKPRVRLLKKTLTHSARTQVTCLATGFYPRHINLTLLRDGQPVPEDQLTGGLLLPNTDGTYQMRKSMEVSAREVKCNYTCVVTHLSLDNKLDISVDYDPGPSILPIVLFVLVALFVLVMIPIAGCIIWKKCAGHKELTQNRYIATASTEDNECSTDSKYPENDLIDPNRAY